MSEWFGNQKQSSSKLRQLLQERIEKANPRRKLTCEEAKRLHNLGPIADKLRRRENMQTVSYKRDEAKKNERANALKEAKHFYKEFIYKELVFTAGMLKSSLAKGKEKMKLFDKLLNVSIGTFTRRFKRFSQERKFAAHSHPKVYNWDWKNKGFNRIASVNFLVSISGGLNAKYLEIGCASNALFDSVASLSKVGVDPASGGTHRMTSDEFFANNQETFDVVFIDGLHEYEQVHRDAVNALNSVKVGGYVAFHDLLPSTWKEHHVPRISNAWTGDCWKLAVQLMESNNIEFVILDIDHGVGVLKKISDEWNVPSVTEDLKSAEFDRFVAIADKLPIYPFTDGINKVVAA